jgi:hypothetical protein
MNTGEGISDPVAELTAVALAKTSLVEYPPYCCLW